MAPWDFAENDQEKEEFLGKRQEKQDSGCQPPIPDLSSETDPRRAARQEVQRSWLNPSLFIFPHPLDTSMDPWPFMGHDLQTTWEQKEL